MPYYCTLFSIYDLVHNELIRKVAFETPFLYCLRKLLPEPQRQLYHTVKLFLVACLALGIPFLLCRIHFTYNVGYSFIIIWQIVPSSNLCTLSFISAFKKTPGLSVKMSYCPSFASIAHDIIIASNDTACELILSFNV